MLGKLSISNSNNSNMKNAHQITFGTNLAETAAMLSHLKSDPTLEAAYNKLKQHAQLDGLNIDAHVDVLPTGNYVVNASGPDQFVAQSSTNLSAPLSLTNRIQGLKNAHFDITYKYAMHKIDVASKWLTESRKRITGK